MSTAGKDEDRVDLARILVAWMSQSTSTRAGPVGITLSRFPFASSNDVFRTVGKAPSVSAGQVWMAGPPVEIGSPVLFPVATVAVGEAADGGPKVVLRVATFCECAGRVSAHGWRFEMAESEAAPHPWAHCQRINTWDKGGVTLLYPDPTEDAEGDEQPASERPFINETRPAVPVPVRSIGGLGLAMLASLYGAQAARLMLADVRLSKNQTEATIREDLRALRLV